MNIKDSTLTIHNRNSRITTRYFDKIFRENNCPINSTQYDLMRIIMAKPGLPLTRLGEEIGIDRTTLTRRLPKLVNMGYIKYIYDKDGRNRPPQITKDGLEIIKKYSDIYENADKEISSKINLSN